MSVVIKKEKLQNGKIHPVWYSGQNKGELGLSGLAHPYKIEKRWGYELIYQNHSLYCCKLLHINKNCSCSFHLHLEKHETLTVIKGTLVIDSIIDKKKESFIVEKGQSFVIAPGFIHSLRALNEDVDLIESSTPSYDTDSIRISEGENNE